VTTEKSKNQMNQKERDTVAKKQKATKMTIAETKATAAFGMGTQEQA